MCHLPSVKVLVLFILGFVCFVLDEFGFMGEFDFLFVCLLLLLLL